MHPVKMKLVALCALAAFAGGSQAQSVRIVDEGRIGDEWMLAEGATVVAPGYPGAFAARGDNVCIAMGYRINADGTTGDFTTLRSWSSSSGEHEPEPGFWEAFSRASAGALAQWRFTPRPEVRLSRPVDTVATLSFVGQRPQDGGSLRAQCRVPDLRAALDNAKRDLARRGDMNSRTMDRNYRETTRNESRPNHARSGMNVD